MDDDGKKLAECIGQVQRIYSVEIVDHNDFKRLWTN